jgi:methyl-accepting chemotaxis protein
LILLAEEMRPLVTQSRHTAHALIGHVTGIQDDTQQIMATIQNIRLQTVESVQYTNQLRAALQTLQRQTNTHIQEAQGVAEVVQDTQLATEALQPALDQIAAGTYAVYLAANRARCEGEFLTDTLQGIGDTAQQTEVAISRLAVVQQQIAEFTSLLAEGVPEQKQKLQQISETAQNLTGQTHALVGHLEPFQRVATQENTLPARKTA